MGVIQINKRSNCSFAILRLSGFTLVEMLIVIAILGILAALLIPSLQNSLESVRRAVCANNLRQNGVGINMYVTDHNGNVPVGIHTVTVEAVWFEGLSFMAYNNEMENHGLLYGLGYITAPEVFICSSIDQYSAWWQRGQSISADRWPDSISPPGSIVSSYAFNHSALLGRNVPALNNPFAVAPLIKLQSILSQPRSRSYRFVAMADLREIKSQPSLSGRPAVLEHNAHTTHKKEGINALMWSGSVHWVPTDFTYYNQTVRTPAGLNMWKMLYDRSHSN